MGICFWSANPKVVRINAKWNIAFMKNPLAFGYLANEQFVGETMCTSWAEFLASANPSVAFRVDRTSPQPTSGSFIDSPEKPFSYVHKAIVA